MILLATYCFEERSMRDSCGLTRRSVLTGVVATSMMVGRTAAQDWPARPVKVIVPYPAGGGADTACGLRGL
jgi:tripartite-type tricarboxylate transporter receptor subunit TctC